MVSKALSTNCFILVFRDYVLSKLVSCKILFFPLILGLLLSACESEYDRGYSEGYSKGENYGYELGYASGKNDGYQVGKKEGYQEGDDDGYKKGYANGTVTYVKEHGLPSLGLAVIILIFLAAVYYLYRSFKDPARRVIEKTTDAVEVGRQKKIVKKELLRKRFSVEERARIKAHNLATRVFEKTIEAITDEKSRAEIETLRQKAEKKILAIQLEEISKIADEYQGSVEELKASQYLSSKEKAELFSEIREVFNEA